MTISSRLFAVFVLFVLFAAQPVIAQRLGPTLSDIKQQGTVTIGYRETSVPFSYLSDKGKPEGYTIDICMHVVDAIKKEIGADDIDIKYVPVTPQTRIPLIANGTIDMECGSTTNTLTRQKQVDYSYTTFITGTRILTRADSDIDSVDDLSGHVIGLAPGTTNAQAIQDTIKARNIENVKILSVTDHAEGFLALRTGRADAYSTDDILLYGLIAKSDNPKQYKVVGDYLSYDPYAIMLPQNDSQLRLVVDRTLANLFRSGDIKTIYNKWFGPMSVPISDDLAENFKLNAFPK